MFEFDALHAYCRRIRNAAKRCYAQQYLGWRLATSPDGDSPRRPANLSYMAAQAVRIDIDRMLGETLKKLSPENRPCDTL